VGDIKAVRVYIYRDGRHTVSVIGKSRRWGKTYQHASWASLYRLAEQCRQVPGTTVPYGGGWAWSRRERCQ
jgi:hypothetical protein